VKVLYKKSKIIPIIALMGLLAPVIAMVSISVSILLSPDFSFKNNALSDLGHWTRTDIGPNPFLRALIFNVGLITTGILMSVTTIWLMKRIEDNPTTLSLTPLLLSVLSLTSIGIFSEDIPIQIGGFTLHFIASVGFFSTFPLSMWLTGFSLLRYEKLRWFSLLSLLLPFTSIYLWWGTFKGRFPWTGVAIPEMITAFTSIIWIWTFLGLEVKESLPKTN
jgi:hypothetical membrane protein